MRRIVLWGSGKIALKLLEYIKAQELPIEIVAVVDNMISKQGSLWHGYEIQSPQIINTLQFDKIVTPLSAYDEICRQLINLFGQEWIESTGKAKIDLIDNYLFLQREAFLEYYKNTQILEKRLCINYVKTHPLAVFNYEFRKQYADMPIDVYWDTEKGLYYVYYQSKRMYMSRTFNTVEKVTAYMRQILMEQDEKSPHRYFDQNFTVSDGSIVLDAGVAEGNFALEIIDKAKTVYLVEVDELWVEALTYTFAPYGDKVIIIQKFLSDHDGNGCITIDRIIQSGQLDFIKLDIEGAEIQALKGGKQTLLHNNVTLSVCSYHRESDNAEISELLIDLGYRCWNSKGYMVFIYNEYFKTQNPPKLVRGLIRSKKVKSLYIWGGGRRLEVVFQAIKQENTAILGIVDSNTAIQGTLWKQMIPIVPPEILLKESFDYIIISIQNYKEVYEYCLESGIEEKRIFCFWKEGKSEDLQDILDYKACRMHQLEILTKRYAARLNNYPYEIMDESPALEFPIIKPAEELIDLLLNKRYSLCRYGDNEFELMRGKKRTWYQDVDDMLKMRLREVMSSKNKNTIIAIANDFGSLEKYTEEAADGIRRYLTKDTREEVINLLEPKRIYYDAYISRPYMIYKDKKGAAHRFQRLKLIWKDRDVLIIEGKYGRFGIGNDLLGGASSVRRILCPSENAFYKYPSILECVLKIAKKDDLLLIALGPTATVLAHDMALNGFQALDIGQLDNEYEWFLKKVVSRVALTGKMTAEIPLTGFLMGEMEAPEYKDQIVAEIE